VTDPDLAAAWDALRSALPAGWTVGRPSHRSEERRWLLYAFDPRERPKAGKRTRAVEATASTELEVIREMARRLSTLA
jgi:hypothetical protein